MDDLRGRVIRSYQLEEPIGSGGFGAVYRAHQSVVNREVAIKIILPSYANHPDFIRRFEVEAQLVAALEHPHIIPLYDFWREPDGAYLVMRYLRGGNLRSSLRTQTWNVEDIAAMLDQIAAALTVAHRHDVVHRDIKPDNILLDEDNNAYLSDFGTAADLIGQRNPKEQKTVIGSPEYMAPEQILREPMTSQTDIYSLGIVLYEILTGKRPFSGDTVTQVMNQQVNDPIPPLQAIRPDLPIHLNLVIWRATAKNPDGRYPDVLTLAREFRAAVGRDESRLATRDDLPVVSSGAEASAGGTLALEDTLEPVNPYKGLRAFEESDSRFFFGRETSRDELLDKLEKRVRDSENSARFLALVGPSGSGKSSLVKAGLIPALRRGDLAGSENWFIATMTPGAHPFEELQQALLRIASGGASNALDRLAEDQQGLYDAVETLLPYPEDGFVLVIDQFEEVFTLVEDEGERARFLDSLHHAVTAPGGRLWVFVTLRADYYDRPLLYAGLGDLLRQYTEVVLPLSPEELERAVDGPAERAGISLEPGLVATIVADVSRQPGALPLLQYALTELFERREDSTLTLKAYRDIGGVLGALARRADDLYQEFDPPGQEIARQLFLRLVTLDEDSEVTRQRAMWSEWASISGGDARFQPIVDTFARYRLLTLDRDPVTRAPTIQLAHEALVREWQQLRDWIDSSRDDLRVQRQLASSAAEWISAQRDPSYLASGARLVQFEGLLTGKGIRLSGDETAYLHGSIAQRRRATTRLRLFILLLALISVVALTLAAFAFDRQRAAIVQRDRADLQGRISRSRELSVTALLNQPQLDLSLLLSLEAIKTADTFEARNSLLTALQSNPRLETYLRGHADAVRAVAFSPDGRWLASGGRDNQVILWNVAAHAPDGDPLTGHEGWVNSVAFSPDSRLLVSGSADGTIRLWDVEPHEAVASPLTGHEGAVWSVVFSPDGQAIVSGGADGTVRQWDANTGHPVGKPLIGHEDIVYSVAFSPDGKTIASGSADGTVRLWDANTGQPIGEPLAGHTNWVLAVAFSPDGQILASSGADSTIMLWNMETRELSQQFFSGHTNWVRSLAFSPDGQTLISGSADGTARLFDVASGQMTGDPLAGHMDAIWSAAFAPDGHTIATGSADRTIILWAAADHPALMRSWIQQPDPLSSVAFSPDGTLLATGGGSQLEALPTDIRLWNVASGAAAGTLKGHEGPITNLAFSPDGGLLASAGADQSVIVWDVTTRQLIRRLLGHTDVVWSVTFSPDGKWIASGGDDGSVRLWDARTGESVGELLAASSTGVTSLAFSPDGSLLAAANRDNTITLWNLETRQPVGQPLAGHTDVVTGLAFIPNSTFLVSSSRDTTLILWDTAHPESPKQAFSGHSDWVLSLAVSPDGQMLASGSRDTTVILWDVTSGKALGQPFTGHTDWVNTVAFSPDGQTLASGGNDTFAILRDVSLAAWQGRACAIANGSLTEEEWQRFFPDQAYQPAC